MVQLSSKDKFDLFCEVPASDCGGDGLGVTAATLVAITLYQYGKLEKKLLVKYLDGFFFPRAIHLLLMYAARNNYIMTLLHNKVIQELVENDDEVEIFLNVVGGGESRKDEWLENLILKAVSTWRGSDVSEKILVADELIHYQHVTGNFLDENIEEEYRLAEFYVFSIILSTSSSKLIATLGDGSAETSVHTSSSARESFLTEAGFMKYVESFFV